MLALLHTVCGFLALALGAAVLLRRKGTKSHRLLGATYAVIMLTLNISAFSIFNVFGSFGIFHAFAILSLVTLSLGLFAVICRVPRKNWLYFHYQWMAWSYAGLLGATINEAFAHIPLLASAVVSYRHAILASQVIFFTVAATLINLAMKPTVARYGSRSGL
jgi:uncharacterized membrane protein